MSEKNGHEKKEKVQRVFTSLEEARDNKPTDDPKRAENWKLFTVTLPNFQDAGTTTYFGWSGGGGVFQNNACHFHGIRVRLVDSNRGGNRTVNDLRSDFAALSEEDREKFMEEFSGPKKKKGTKKQHEEAVV